MLVKKRQSFIWLTALAIFTLFLLLLWRQGRFPAPFLIAWGMIAWGVAFFWQGRPFPTKKKSYLKWTASWQGALVWFGGALVGFGFVWLIGHLQDSEPSLQTLKQEFTGFTLAYLIHLIIFHLYHWLAD